MAIFRLIQNMFVASKSAVQAVLSSGQRILGWWIGRRRGWTPDSRDYGAQSGYVVRHTNRSYWWDGERLTSIIER
jgi:hypothetical protein